MANGPNMLCPNFPLLFSELFTQFCRGRLTNSYRRGFPDGHWNFLSLRKQVKCQDELIVGSITCFLKFSDSFLSGELQLPSS